jgi:hypothetical protein
MKCQKGISCWVLIGLLAGGTFSPAPVQSQKSAPQPVVGSGVTVSVYAVPESHVPPTNLAVGQMGIPLVPVGGGVAVAGFNGWFIEPPVLPIHSVSFAPNDILVFTQEMSDGQIAVLRSDARSRAQARVAIVPRGRYQIAAVRTDVVWIWGRQESGLWTIWHAESGGHLREIYQGDTPVTALAAIGEHAAAVAIGSHLLLLRRGALPVQIGRLKDAVHGLASGPQGSLYLTTSRGLFRMDHANRLTALATGITGPAVYQAGSIYVLERASRRVYRVRVPASMET